MAIEVLCLRPKADFERLDALPSPALAVSYHAPEDDAVPALMKRAQALVIPAVGGKLATSLFENTALKLIQVTGAGLDRLDRAGVTRLGIPVANVPGNIGVAEYAVTSALTLLRRFAWAGTFQAGAARCRSGDYRCAPRVQRTGSHFDCRRAGIEYAGVGE